MAHGTLQQDLERLSSRAIQTRYGCALAEIDGIAREFLADPAAIHSLKT
jgi:hypothetical protein